MTGCFFLLVTKGSVSYLSLLEKAYCRQGHPSGPDFAVFSRENHLRMGGVPPFPSPSSRGSDPPGPPFSGVCKTMVFLGKTMGFLGKTMVFLGKTIVFLGKTRYIVLPR